VPAAVVTPWERAAWPGGTASRGNWLFGQRSFVGAPKIDHALAAGVVS
ncbi:uncharacterized protein METZ01_LOCUS46005, partial [marine metagenome]